MPPVVAKLSPEAAFHITFPPLAGPPEIFWAGSVSTGIRVAALVSSNPDDRRSRKWTCYTLAAPLRAEPIPGRTEAHDID